MKLSHKEIILRMIMLIILFVFNQAEELFFNNSTRRKALRSAADEYAFIAEVVRAYAMRNPHCSFVLKKVTNIAHSNTCTLRHTHTDLFL